MSQDMTRGQLEQRTRELYATLSAVDSRGVRDLDAIAAFFTDDLAYESPFNATPRVLNSREDFIAFLGRLQGLFVNTKYTFNHFHCDLETQTVVVECRSTRQTVATGETIAIRYVFVFRYRDGKIAEMREYTFTTNRETLMRTIDGAR